ncbi:dATP/dGTP diphosphohydrolase domain-containing protein [Acinetobacter sp. ANC 7454]|uniref:dATP/dGTP diphosphohydrolase domain-containing protein n=1 Tax=Acinetobacter thermotolerans TaxID=3151487 RepID=UPI00325C2A80
MAEEGKKFDAEKPRFSLIPQGVISPVINVLEFGAQKYSEGNWKFVPNARTRYFDAAHRHLDAWWNGESRDKETGESHLAHAICCLMFLLSMSESERKADRTEAVSIQCKHVLVPLGSDGIEHQCSICGVIL